MPLADDDVLRMHWGLLPARLAGTERLAVRLALHGHGAARSPDGLSAVSGGKSTTVRPVSADWPDASAILALDLSEPAEALAPIRAEILYQPDDSLLCRTD